MTFIETLVLKYLMYKVTFYSLLLFWRKGLFHMQPQFLEENLRKYLTCNGLRRAWPILDPNNILIDLRTYLLTLIVIKWLWLTVWKDPLFWSMSATKIRNFFNLPRMLYLSWQVGKIWSWEGEYIKSYPIIIKK